MANRNYSNVAQPQALTQAAAVSDSTVTVASTTGYPDPPFLIAFERGTANEEIAQVTAMTATTFTCNRGFDNTTAKNHLLGTQVEHAVAAIDYREAGDHITSTQDVHGIGAGAAVVGTSTNQVLTNKTIDGASNTITNVSAAAITGVLAAGNVPDLSAAKITSGTVAFARLPVGTSSTTVAVGNHTHTQSQINGGVLDATTIQGRRIYVQSTDPGGNNGDLWFQPV